MRHVACETVDCLGKGAAFFDFEPDAVIVLCPLCGSAMAKIPTPELGPPPVEEQEPATPLEPLVPQVTLEEKLVSALEELGDKAVTASDLVAILRSEEAKPDA